MIPVFLFLTPLSLFLHTKYTLRYASQYVLIILKQKFAASVVKVGLVFPLTEKLTVCYIDANHTFA